MSSLPLLSEPLWSGLALVAPLRARVSGTPPEGVAGISIDTRTLQQGDLFVALKGHAGDGHDHVEKAFAAGAAAALVDEAHALALAGKGTLYIAQDTLAALEGLARAARARCNGRIAAITGSVGKTSTKEMLALVLGAAGATHAAVASYNNHWGVPLTLARMPQGARFGVFEIGMNHAGEITPLAAMAAPHVAVITNVAPVHTENFADGVDGVARAKAEVFSGIAKGGLAIINRGNRHFEFLAAQAKASPARFMLSFGGDGADAVLESVETFPEGSYVVAKILGESLRYRIGAPGRHFAENSLAVLLAAKAMGLQLSEAAQTLELFQPPAGRGQRLALHLPGGGATLIDESYNANPASMRAAFAVLAALPVRPGGRRIAALGDMLELGPQENAVHAELAEAVENANIDLVFAAGPRMRHLYDALSGHRRAAWAASAAELQPILAEALRPGDVLMVKGSNGSRMGPLAKALAQHFAPAPTLP